DASQVTMDDPVTGGWTFAGFTAPAGFSCTAPPAGASSGSLNCSNPSMAVGSAVFTVTFHIPDNTPPAFTFTNTATVSTTASDPNTGNNSASAMTSTPPSTDIAVIKTAPAQA